MRSAIILLDKENDLKFAFRPVLDRTLVELVVRELHNADVLDVSILSEDTNHNINGAKMVSSLNDAIKHLDAMNSDVLIIDAVYPNLTKDTYAKMFEHANSRIHKTRTIKLSVKDIINIKNIKFEDINVSEDELKTINTNLELYEYNQKLRREINLKHLENDVNIFDIDHTFIGPDVKIESGVSIYPNVYLNGETVIKENSTIFGDSYLKDAKIGANTSIISSRITDSEVKNNVTIGPNSHLRMNSIVEDNVRIGNYVEFKNTHFGIKSRCAHLTYLGDSEVGNDVNIGCGVVTVNYDGAHKFQTKIGDHSFIGSNSNLIAPIEVGENAVVAAGSTIYQNVESNDMAIARSYQTIKKGRGYSYVNKEK